MWHESCQPITDKLISLTPPWLSIFKTQGIYWEGPLSQSKTLNISQSKQIKPPLEPLAFADPRSCDQTDATFTRFEKRDAHVNVEGAFDNGGQDASQNGATWPRPRNCKKSASLSTQKERNRRYKISISRDFSDRRNGISWSWQHQPQREWSRWRFCLGTCRNRWATREHAFGLIIFKKIKYPLGAELQICWAERAKLAERAELA